MQKSRFWSNSWLSKIAGRAKCQKYLPTTKLSIWHSRPRTTGWTCELRSDKNSYQRPCSVDRSRRRTIECLFVTACSMDQYAEENKTEKNLIVRSGISEAETTNNKRLRSTFCIEAIQTRSIARPLCDSRASCLRPTFIPYVAGTPKSNPGNSCLEKRHKHEFVPSVVTAERRWRMTACCYCWLCRRKVDFGLWNVAGSDFYICCKSDKNLKVPEKIYHIAFANLWSWCQ